MFFGRGSILRSGKDWIYKFGVGGGGEDWDSSCGVVVFVGVFFVSCVEMVVIVVVDFDVELYG